MRTTFLYDDVTRRERNRLPHYDADNGIYFVTFSLRDAITPAFFARHRRERREMEDRLRGRDGKVALGDLRRIDKILIARLFAEMDRARGSCVFRDPRAASIVADSLRYFDGTRYRMYAYSVMPNHVHTVFRALPGVHWGRIVGNWKSFTAREVNRLLDRKGSLWQHDSFDRLVRNSRHLERVVTYVLNNPAKAGLSDWPWTAQLIGPPWDGA